MTSAHTDAATMRVERARGPVAALGSLVGAGWAFLHRGVATYLSYRAKLSLGLASLLMSVLTFALVGRVVAAAGSGFVDRYGTDYASFAVVGVAVHAIAGAGLRCFRSAVRREQLQGTLELLAAARLPFPLAVLLSGLGELAVVGAGGAAFLAAARLLLGIELEPSGLAVGAAVLYAVFMSGLGVAAAGFILVFKEGEPVSWLFGAVCALLGGVYFPIDLMPAWLSRVALAVPTTHALSLVRSGCFPSGGSAAAAASVPGASPMMSLLVLSVAAVSSVAGGALVLSWGYRTARTRGSLGQY